MRKEAKITLCKFLILYAGSLVVFLGIIGVGYYKVHSHEIIKQQHNELRLVAFNAVRMLRSGITPPDGIEWTLINYDGSRIAGDFDLPEFTPCHSENSPEQYVTDNKYCYLIVKLPPRMDAAYISVRTPIKKEALEKLKLNVILIWSGAFVFFMTIATILSYLFLKPLRKTIDLMDRFIKDATHELTTPISAILMSVEAIEKESMSERNRKRLDRIGVAARTLQVVYDDLAYLLLNTQEKREPKELDLIALIHQRVNYLRPAAEVRNLSWRLDLKSYKPPVVDAREFARILDNLLSNAIKYNRHTGEIYIKLEGNTLTIADEGSGIKKENRNRIYERFARFEESQGGFGLGLGIVKELCIRNNLTINFTSIDNKGTQFYISW